MLLLKLAWRNSWRNSRRSIITAATVVTALFFAVMLESLNKGVTDYLIDNEINLYTAHLEVHREGYLQKRNIDHAIAHTHELGSILLSFRGVSTISRRMEMLVLASQGDQSMPGMLVGIDKAANQHLKKLLPSEDHILAGRKVSMGKGLAEKLGLSLGDSVVLIGQSYYGRIAADIFLVSNIFDVPIKDINERIILAPIELVGDFAGIPGGATSILVTMHDREMADEAQKDLYSILVNSGFEITTWKDILSGRLSAFKFRRAGTMVFKGILYIILGFGILGAILLTYHERRHECGMLMAMGLKRSKLAVMLLLEMLMVAGFGILAGIFTVLPVVSFFYHKPIRLTGELALAMEQFNVEPLLVMSNHFSVFLTNILMVFSLTLILSGLSLGMVIRLKWIRAANSNKL